jgi:hypothetical protein
MFTHVLIAIEGSCAENKREREEILEVTGNI